MAVGQVATQSSVEGQKEVLAEHCWFYDDASPPLVQNNYWVSHMLIPVRLGEVVCCPSCNRHMVFKGKFKLGEKDCAGLKGPYFSALLGHEISKKVKTKRLDFEREKKGVLNSSLGLPFQKKVPCLMKKAFFL